MADLSTFQAVASVANGILSIVACLILILVGIGGIRIWRAVGRARVQIATIQREIAPAMASIRRVAGNLESVSDTLRTNVEAISTTVDEANDRVRGVVHLAEDRLRRLDLAVGAAQEEVEAALVDVVATARGVRAGAGMLRGILGIGLGDGGMDAPAPRRSRRHETMRRASSPVGETETMDTDDFVDEDDDSEEVGNGRARPRARSQRSRP